VCTRNATNGVHGDEDCKTPAENYGIPAISWCSQTGSQTNVGDDPVTEENEYEGPEDLC
jgi:hypothetical protein